MCLKMQRESVTSDNGRLLVCNIVLDWCSFFYANTHEPFNMDLTILSFICAVLQNSSVIKYLSLGGRTLSYMERTLCK